MGLFVYFYPNLERVLMKGESKMDWHALAIELARKGYSMKEIAYRVCEECEESGVKVPTYSTITSYLHRNGYAWGKYSSFNPKTKQPFNAEAFTDLKKNTIKAARELFYSETYISQLKKAKTEGELNRIMATARERSYED